MSLEPSLLDPFFWPQRFVEHFRDFIPAILERLAHSPQFSKYITPSGWVKRRRLSLHLAEQWANVAASACSAAPSPASPPGVSSAHMHSLDEMVALGLPRLVEESIEVKHTLHRELSEAGVPCWPGALSHMIEEVDYYRDTVLRNRLSDLDKLVYWLNKHDPEEVDLLACVLPNLLAEDAERLADDNASPSPDFKKASAEAFDLLEQLQKPLPHVRSLVEAADLAWKQGDTGLLSSVLAEVNRLHNEKFRLLQQFVVALADLPLFDDTREILQSMIRHEMLEERHAMREILAPRRAFDEPH